MYKRIRFEHTTKVNDIVKETDYDTVKSNGSSKFTSLNQQA